MSSALRAPAQWYLVSLVSMKAESCCLLLCWPFTHGCSFCRRWWSSVTATLATKAELQCVTALFIQRDYRSFVCVWRIYKLQFLVRETAGSTLADTNALGSIRYCCRSSGTAYQPAALPLVPAIKPWFEFGSATVEPHIHPCQSSCTLNARIMPLSNVQGK